MSKTRHIETRMKQRGISDFMLNIATKYGEIEENSERITLARKPLRKMICELEQSLKRLKTMERFGGITVVKCNENLVTTFTVDSYRRG